MVRTNLRQQCQLLCRNEPLINQPPKGVHWLINSTVLPFTTNQTHSIAHTSSHYQHRAHTRIRQASPQNTRCPRKDERSEPLRRPLPQTHGKRQTDCSAEKHGNTAQLKLGIASDTTLVTVAPNPETTPNMSTTKPNAVTPIINFLFRNWILYDIIRQRLSEGIYFWTIQFSYGWLCYNEMLFLYIWLDSTWLLAIDIVLTLYTKWCIHIGSTDKTSVT